MLATVLLAGISFLQGYGVCDSRLTDDAYDWLVTAWYRLRGKVSLPNQRSCVWGELTRCVGNILPRAHSSDRLA